MKLIQGDGSPSTGADWMSAINYYTNGNALVDWHTHPQCVCPVIRSLALILNDLCADHEREKLIGPHLFEPVGTAADAEITQKRTFRVVDVAIREFAPALLEMCERYEDANALRSLAPIVNEDMVSAAIQALKGTAKIDPASLLRASNIDVLFAYTTIIDRADTITISNLADALIFCFAGIEFKNRERLLALILELCAMWRTDVKPARTKEAVLAALDTGQF